MKTLSPRPIIFIMSSSRSFLMNPLAKPHSHRHTLLQISYLSTSTTTPFHSSPSSSYPSRRHEEESRNVRVSVWWDFENCGLPAGSNVFRVAQSITAAIRANGIKGPIQITAFGDIMQLSRVNQEALSSTGINLTHIPNGGKNSADRSLLVDLMYWVSQNPPPAHLFLISGDRDFAGILHRLRMNNYNILLASPERAPGVLCSAASIMWQWNALVRGENINGKHFNQPPDGPYGSWYGHYRAPLDDPFAVTEQSTCLRAEESSESGPDPKLRPIPKVVMKHIRHIMNLYPKGISITELRSELARSNIGIDKDLYGYKKFSRFLLAMPHVLKLQPGGDGQFFVRGVVQKVPEQLDPGLVITSGPITNADPDFTSNLNLNGENGSYTGVVDEKTSLPLTCKPNMKDPSKNLQESATKMQEPQRRVQEPSAPVEVTSSTKPTECNLHYVVEQDSTSEMGFFKRIWWKWFSAKDGVSEKKSCKQEKWSTEKLKTEEKDGVSTTQSVGFSTAPASISSSCVDPDADDKLAGNTESDGNKSSSSPGILRQIMKWCKVLESSTDLKNTGEKPSGRVKSDSKKHEMFLKECFWNDMEAFMYTPQCSDVISQSSSRKLMAQNLQKLGPLVLRSLNENELLDLVDLLISDKKWVEECPSQTFPFKLTRPVGKSSVSISCGSSRLRSLFLGNQAKSNLKSVSEQDEENKFQNLPHSGVSESIIQKKPSVKSRSEMLADCQKLVDYVVKEYPEGFNMAAFRKLFLEKYGYPLDVQKLGYQKLATLLQTMPAARIESTYIIPGSVLKASGLETVDNNVQEKHVDSTVSNSDSELSDVSKKDDDLDSPWDELGPVANTGSKSNEKGLELSRKVSHGGEEPKNHYETLSDDDFSDLEEETSPTKGLENNGRPRIHEEDSSLLQILDSWYRSKEDNNRTDASENVNGMVDCSRYASPGVGIKSESHSVNYGQKQRPSKSYLFVSDQGGDEKDKLLDGILGSLKKSGEKSAESSI